MIDDALRNFVKPINLSILDFKAVHEEQEFKATVAINLSILDFKGIEQKDIPALLNL